MVGGSSLEGFTVSSANKVMVRRHILLGVRMHGKGVVLMLVGLLELTPCCSHQRGGRL